jgi:hypothetical protein
MKFTIGSDPEAFIINDSSGKVVSAKRFTLGTKDDPEVLGGGYAILNDNILIEGNVPPANNKEEFVINMTNLWNVMNDRAKEREAHLHNADCMEITDALFNTPEAQEFGCSSFRDAWNDMIEISTPQLEGLTRPAGCHIHIGFEKNLLEKYGHHFRQAVVRLFDMNITLPAIKITGKNYRTNNLYGLLGACRITSYGVECRSLGGTFFDLKYFEWIYDKVEGVIETIYWENNIEKNLSFILGLPSIHTYNLDTRIRMIEQSKSSLIKGIFKNSKIIA